MAITITLDDEDAVERPKELSLEELVKKIQSTPPNPSQIRPATGSLADALCAAPNGLTIDFESWKQEWASVEAEMKAVTRANDIAEGRGGLGSHGKLSVGH